MCVLSNNSPRVFGSFKVRENAPEDLLKILSVLEEIVRNFEVKIKDQGNSTIIMVQEKRNLVQGEFLKIIILEIFSEPKSYSMELYHQEFGSINQKLVYEVKVKGNYELNSFKKNLEKLINGKNLTHRPKFYPF